MSQTIKSGKCCWASFTPSIPFSAPMPSKNNPSKASRILSRKAGSSSISKIFIELTSFSLIVYSLNLIYISIREISEFCDFFYRPYGNGTLNTFNIVTCSELNQVPKLAFSRQEERQQILDTLLG